MKNTIGFYQLVSIFIVLLISPAFATDEPQALQDGSAMNLAPYHGSDLSSSPASDQRNTVYRRQWKMDRRYDAMNQIKFMLSKQIGFDRAKAINLAHQLKHSSAENLLKDFNKQSIDSYDSNVNNNFWSDQKIFAANALALKQTAETLIKELEKVPTAEEGAIMLSTGLNPFNQSVKDTVPVSPTVWDAYRAVTMVCNNCHQRFRN